MPREVLEFYGNVITNMAVTIRRAAAIVAEAPKVEVAPVAIATPPEVPKIAEVRNLSQVVQRKAEAGLPKGRNYRQGKGLFNRNSPPKPNFRDSDKKSLAQILPKRYNAPIVIQPDSVASTSKFCRCDYCRDSGKVTVYDICGFCDGAGCAKCNNIGEIKNLIPCQECAKRKI